MSFENQRVKADVVKHKQVFAFVLDIRNHLTSLSSPF